jgi:hypothetical protein
LERKTENTLQNRAQMKHPMVVVLVNQKVISTGGGPRDGYEVGTGWSTIHGEHKSKGKLHKFFNLQGDSELLSGCTWPIIFKPETIK